MFPSIDIDNLLIVVAATINHGKHHGMENRNEGHVWPKEWTANAW